MTPTIECVIPRWCCRKSQRSPNTSTTMSASGAFAASRHNAVAPGDSFSRPALAAVNPTSEWVRLSNQINRLKAEAPLEEAERIDPGPVFSAHPQLLAPPPRWVEADCLSL